jgi:hypothetical protein
MSKQVWSEGLPEEIYFWDTVISGTFFPGEDEKQAFRQRVTGETPFPQHLMKYMHPGARRVLDVGAGPATVLGLQGLTKGWRWWPSTPWPTSTTPCSTSTG